MTLAPHPKRHSDAFLLLVILNLKVPSVVDPSIRPNNQKIVDVFLLSFF